MAQTSATSGREGRRRRGRGAGGRRSYCRRCQSWRRSCCQVPRADTALLHVFTASTRHGTDILASPTPKVSIPVFPSLIHRSCAAVHHAGHGAPPWSAEAVPLPSCSPAHPEHRYGLVTRCLGTVFSPRHHAAIDREPPVTYFVTGAV